MLALLSCNKAETTPAGSIPVIISEQTINATVDKNEEYRLTLPYSATGYSIATPAGHSATSTIVSGNESEVLVYTPDENYTGSDALLLVASDTLEDGQHGGCNKGQDKQRSPQRTVRQQKLHIKVEVLETATSS